MLTSYQPWQNRELDLNKPVEIYRCLTPGRGRYSIRQGRYVVGHAEALTITDATFVVSRAGHNRRLRLGHKIVYAHAKGLLATQYQNTPTRIIFDNSQGVFRNGELPIKTAKVVYLGVEVRAFVG